MINPQNEKHRTRLSRAMDGSFQQLQRFSAIRDSTIRAYLGYNQINQAPDWAELFSSGNSNRRSSPNRSRYRRSLPKGNLLQMAGLGMQVALAYGEPQFLVKARMPEHIGLAERMTAALNRMATLLNLGEVARNVAADSYFGYGIFKVGIGQLPLSAAKATGLDIGPNIWRVSQNDLIYDIRASSWDNAAYIGDTYTMPVDEAMALYPGQEDRLHSMMDVERVDAKHVMPHKSSMEAAQEEVKLLDVYLPGAGVVVTWPVRGDSFGEVANEPLIIREYNGHWSGIYNILNHLYSPDELAPVAQAESVKSLHFLFNEIMDLTSEQALNAKINPTYRRGTDADMQKLWDAKDRVPVGLTQMQPGEQAFFEVPGPSQSQTAFMGALLNFFREFVPTFDQPTRAPTATQANLERQTTSAVVAEARRKFNRSLQLVGYKLGHLLLNSNDIVLPSSRPLYPGSDVPVDITFRGSEEDPRVAAIDDFDLSIEPYSLQFRSPQDRLQQLFQVNQQLVAMMQLGAQGAPINIQNVLNTLSEYSGLPELKEWYQEVDPTFQPRRQQGDVSSPRIGVGQYVRENVSAKTNAGQIEQALSQNMGSDFQTQQGNQ